jgi:hypothetical protein
VRLIDTGSIDADNASVYGVEFGGNFRTFICRENTWFNVERALNDVARSGLAGYYLQGSWIFSGRADATTPPLARSRIRAHGSVLEWRRFWR